MARYLGQRLLLSVPTLIGLTIVVFFLVRVVVPVDSVDLKFAGAGVSDPERAAELRKELGITGPIPMQYVGWASKMIRGDFGKSFYTGRSVTEEMMSRLPVSMEVGLGSLVGTVLLALPIGVLSAVKQDSIADYASRGTAILFYALPGFWVATLVLVFGNLWFDFAPSTDYKSLWEDPGANLGQMAIPIVLLGLAPIGTMTRLVRTQVLEVIRQDYIRTARAKGLASSTIYTRHVLRNAMLPIVTVIGLQIPNLIAGTVIFEQIFVLPGVGRYLLDAVQRLDLYVLMATNLFFVTLIVMANLAVDMSYALIDPRIRLS